MSNQNFSSTSYSSFTSSSTSNGQTTGQRYEQHSSSNPNGTTVHTTSQNLGEAPVRQTTQYDATGRQLEGNTSGAGRIEDVTDADRKYEEAIEDEYAKREGGA